LEGNKSDIRFAILNASSKIQICFQSGAVDECLRADIFINIAVYCLKMERWNTGRDVQMNKFESACPSGWRVLFDGKQVKMACQSGVSLGEDRLRGSE
jgi:hypothetical protein